MKNKYFFIGILFFLLTLFGCQVMIQEAVFTAQSSDAFLSSLSVLNGTENLPLNFNTTTYNYFYLLPQRETNSSLVLQCSSSNDKAKVYVNCSQLTPMLNSSNYFYVTVCSEDSTVTKVYTINIFYYDATSAAVLKEFSVNNISPDGFAPDQNSYVMEVTADTFVPLFSAISNAAVIVCTDADGNAIISGTSYNWNLKTSITLTLTVTLGGTNSVYVVELRKVETSASSNIFHNFSDLSAQFATDGYTTVIAGDSLSVGYGFFNGAGFTNAWDTYSGILSWSHMLRDAIHRNDRGFLHADEMLDQNKIVKPVSVSTTRWWSNAQTEPTSSYWMPFNNRNVYFYNIAGADEISFTCNNSNASTNKAVLYFARNPKDTACSFQVKLNNAAVPVKISDQTCRNITVNTVDLSGNKAVAGDLSYLGKTYKNNFYQGFELVVMEVDGLAAGDNIITLTSFINTVGGASCGLFFLGCGTKYSPVYLNGRSGATSDFYIDTTVDNGAFQQRLCIPKNGNNERIAPDCLIWIIGANDSVNIGGTGNNGTNDKGQGKGTVALDQYKTNLHTVLSALRAKNPKIQIILLSSPVWGTSTKIDTNYESRRALLMQYAQVMKDTAEDYGAMFLNNVYLFDNLPVNSSSETDAAIAWRVDTIHFSRFGHTVLAKNLLSKLMATGIYPKDMIGAEIVYCEGTMP